MRHLSFDLASFLSSSSQQQALPAQFGHAGRMDQSSASRDDRSWAEWADMFHVAAPETDTSTAPTPEENTQDDTEETADAPDSAATADVPPTAVGVTDEDAPEPSSVRVASPVAEPTEVETSDSDVAAPAANDAAIDFGDEFIFVRTIGPVAGITDGAGLVAEPDAQSAAPTTNNGRPDTSSDDQADAATASDPFAPLNATFVPSSINGRPDGQVPGAPTVTPPSTEPLGDNESNGRPTDQVPDDGTDPNLLTSYTSGGSADVAFNITVVFEGTWTSELQASFIDAADYLSQMIISDLPDITFDGQDYDDMVITATLEPIDGVSGILGSAGPTLARNGTFLPFAGQMTFDIADAENQLNIGNWEAIIIHEMMHTLGVGTLWELMGLTSGSVSGGDIRFTGQNGTDIYQTEFPTIAGNDPESLTGIPVETDGGPGTAGGHWDELLFDAELMTGFIDAGAFVSIMTIASFEDMGYDTVFDNPYSGTDLFTQTPPDPLIDLLA